MAIDISNYLKEATKEFSKDNIKEFSANSIAEKVELSRSTVSSYLNKEVKQGRIIKIKEYPVIFLYKETFSKLYFTPAQDEYNTLDELWKENSNVKKTDIWSSVIGAKGSLKEQIEQIKTAVLYPENGLPIMLLGSSGSGKTYLAKCIYDYCLEEKLINPKSSFISLNCAQYYHNPELLSSLLFGYTKGAFTGADKDKKGLLESADGGVLFLDEVHRLTEEGQEKLFTFMDSNEYSPIGDNSIKKEAKVRLIFATTESIQSTFLPTFIRRLPVIVNIPSFAERPQQEKIHLIDSFFLKESEILKRTIKVTKQVISFLLFSNYEGNVGKIKNIVKYSCGSSYAKRKDQEIIKVRIGDLPIGNENQLKESLYHQISSRYQDRVYDYLHPELLNNNSDEQKNIKKTYFEFVEGFKQVESGEIMFDHYTKEMVKNVNLLLDELTFNTEVTNNQSFFSVLTFNIKSTFKYMEENYGFEQDGNKILSIAYLLYFKEEQEILINHPDWNSIRPKIINFIEIYMKNILWLSRRMLTHLSERLDFQVLDEDLIFISFYLKSMNIQSLKNEIKSIVLAHGYSTASSMANVANRMLRKNFFQAIDMPIDTTIDHIEEKILDFIDNNSTENGLILLVDMGSLFDLRNRLEKKIKGPLLLIDFVSTPLVLEIGSMLLQDKNIIEINDQILKNVQINKQLVYPVEKKKKAILTCCYTGMGSAIQIQDILQKSLKHEDPSFVIMSYDYHKLYQNKQKELPFQMYDVLAIVGTVDPKVEGIPYIGLDHLIGGEDIDSFINILRCNFNIDEEQLKKDLVFNFSIKKIIEKLTILDVNKVLNFVQDAVDKMEEKLGLKMSNNKRFLLYLHASCMVERILRKEDVDMQEDIKEFVQREKRKIDIIRYAFSEIEKEYTIKISDLEIRLIFDIVLSD
ncbi:sigma 54-interacting transcriptional regulator [Clostridium beijerinckii]|uniref:sigma 54-interacting transcriptional regulator n=1 Tax=Clostridium beijerinckii TaxID=1520 RepID=UPI00098CE76E|nr:sigma 54-interacting transcriptional regulator [Clostridium beijerinckii]MBA8932728.1 sigma-54 dependent transcriptional regulator of gfr operon [Clostridium beijerinckii]NRT37313.1 sigma-54 dependent transcriptional regulator of gfr operon [Clostridium beijerinckii]NRT43253.1 sigma-54 dependent transcriptional regulator of gfr operon [Clostridium beijerinckii]NRU36931.1 sigma-54 dependent transcriptional regulator of gfr operon [Clostridium beijerinckii]NRZ22758.1 sigma-54 dependent transc